MKALKTLYKGYMAFDKVVKQVIRGFCGTGLLILTIVVFVSAISRTFFSHSFTGSDEFAQYLMVWVVLFASILCAEANDLVNVDIIFYILPERLKPFIRIIAHAIACIFLIIFSIFAVDTVQRIKMMGTFSVGIPFFPMWLLYLPATFCTLLMGVEYGKLAIKAVYQLVKAFKAPSSDEQLSSEEGGNN